MRKVHFATILSLAVLLVCSGLTKASAAPTIKNIQFESPSTTTDRIIFTMNGPYLPKGKALPGDNPRVYFDFLDTAPANTVKSSISANGNFVKQIRYAYHKGANAKTRVVFDLLTHQKIEFKQDFDQDTNTLVITVYLAGTEPEPVAVTTPPEPETVSVTAPPEPEPKPVVQEKISQPETMVKESGKKIQPIEDIKVTVADKPEEVVPEPETQVPTQAQDVTPAQFAQEKPEVSPEKTATPEPAPEPETATTPEPIPEQKPEPQEKTPQVAGIPSSIKGSDTLKAPIEEATVIQPLSEVGIEANTSVGETPPVLYSIEFDPESNRGEMISFKLNGFHPPVVFGIEEDMPRIVCFFKNSTAGDELKDMVGTNGQYVKNIKVGKYQNPDNIRVVLELNPGNNYDLQQIFFKDDNIFMMIINKAGKQISTQTN